MSKRFLTCSVTGNLTLPSQNRALPITPRQIAESSLAAAEAGAAAVHIHVRNDDGTPSMKLEHYREAVDLIRAKNSALIINLTTGPGGRFQPGDENPRIAGPRTNLLRPEQRVEHVVALKPDCCSLDLNTMSFGREVVINVPSSVRKMAEIIYECGVKPEIELFDTGDVHLLHDLLGEGAIRRPMLTNFVLGVKYGFPATPRTMAFAADLLPQDAVWSAFGVGRSAFPMLAQAYLLGANLRIGMEDTVHVAKGELTTGNAQLVEKAKWIVEKLGGELMSADETRAHLGLV